MPDGKENVIKPMKGISVQTNEQCIARFKTDVALAAQSNPQIRAFVEAHPEMGVQLQ